MANRKIAMYEYRQIIYRLRQGQSIRAISRDTQFGRHKITEVKDLSIKYNWLLSDTELPSEELLSSIIENNLSTNNNSSRRKCAAFEDLIKQWVEQDVSAKLIHSNLQTHHNYLGGYDTVQRFIKDYKLSKPPKMTVPLHFEPSEAAQVDFGHGPKLFDQRVGKVVQTWYFVMTLCWSRHQYVELITHQDIETWLSCHQNAFDWFGGVVNKVIIDNPKCAITKACYNDPQVQRSYEALAQEYGFLVSACPPRDPQKKGRVESGVKYVKKNFQPLREFRSLQDANQQVKKWVLETAGNRIHGSTFEKPLSQFESIERNVLKPLPAVKPEIATWQKVSLYKDCHVRYQKSRYSAPYKLYDKELWLKSTPTMVTIYHQHKQVSIHTRSFTAGETKTHTEHLPPQAQFYFKCTPQWCLDKSKDIGSQCAFVVESLLTDPARDLLRQAQSLLKLETKYGATRLELACKRANSFNTQRYEAIAKILKNGLDYQSLNNTAAFDSLSPVYQGKGHYQRLGLSTSKH